MCSSTGLLVRTVGEFDAVRISTTVFNTGEEVELLLRLIRIDIGDSLWAFTRTSDGCYVLAAELVVRAKTLNPPNFRYGRYRIWGDLNES